MKVTVENRVKNETLSLRKMMDEYVKTTPTFQSRRTAPKKSQEMILIEQINTLLLRLTQDVNQWRTRFSELEPRLAAVESLFESAASKNDEQITTLG